MLLRFWFFVMWPVSIFIMNIATFHITKWRQDPIQRHHLRNYIKWADSPSLRVAIAINLKMLRSKGERSKAWALRSERKAFLFSANIAAGLRGVQ